MDNKIISNKLLCPILKNNTLVESFAAKEFRLKNQLISDEDKDLDMEPIDKESAWDLARSPAPK